MLIENIKIENQAFEIGERVERVDEIRSKYRTNEMFSTLRSRRRFDWNLEGEQSSKKK